MAGQGWTDVEVMFAHKFCLIVSSMSIPWILIDSKQLVPYDMLYTAKPLSIYHCVSFRDCTGCGIPATLCRCHFVAAI